MAILIDKPGHLISTVGPIELNRFAKSLGLKPEWLHTSNKGYKHYDVKTDKLRRRAISFGAKLVSSKVIVREAKKLRDLINSGIEVTYMSSEAALIQRGWEWVESISEGKWFRKLGKTQWKEGIETEKFTLEEALKEEGMSLE